MAESLGDSAAIPLLQQSLAEEERMAEWIRGQIVPTTERFMQLTRAGQARVCEAGRRAHAELVNGLQE